MAEPTLADLLQGRTGPYVAPVSEFTTPSDLRRQTFAQWSGMDPNAGLMDRIRQYFTHNPATLAALLASIGSRTGGHRARDAVMEARGIPDPVVGGNPRNEPRGGVLEAYSGGPMGGPIYPGFGASSSGLASRNWPAMTNAASGQPLPHPAAAFDRFGWNAPLGYRTELQRQQASRDFRSLTPANDTRN
jgi:hypothetical protein